MSQIGLVLML